MYWARDYVEVPFTKTEAGKIEFAMTLDGRQLNVQLDTGSPVTILSGHAAATFYEIQAGPTGTAQFKSLTLNGIAVNNPTIHISDEATEREFRREHTSKMDSDAIYGISLDSKPLILGTDVLRHLHLYIAYKERKIYATAADAHQ